MEQTKREQEQLDFMKALLTVRGGGDPKVEDKIDQYLRDLIAMKERKEPWLQLQVRKRS